jgi:hemerythrin-like domain-containing protein
MRIEGSAMTSFESGANDVERRFLLQEHRDVARSLNRIGDVAALAGTLAAVDLAPALRNVVEWLEHSFMPHTAWEEEWLYPRLDERAGTVWPGRVMRFEHDQIQRAIEELAVERDTLRHEPTREDLLRLRSRLYGLQAIIHAHLEREEHFLLPVLEAAESGSREPAAVHVVAG